LHQVVNGSLTDLAMRRIGFPWSPELVERSRRSVGATIAAAKAAIIDGIAINLAGGTHHAFADHGQGYCVFNDAAVAARTLQAEANRAQILIVDLDVHQGNGTAHIFKNDPTVFTFSIHSERNYPFRKCDADLDVALPDRADDVTYLSALDDALDEALATAPDFVIYQSGADPYENDRLGRLSLTVNGLLARDRMVITRCRDRGLPIAITMGGGYAEAIEMIVTIHANTVRAACQIERDRLLRPRNQGATPER